MSQTITYLDPAPGGGLFESSDTLTTVDRKSIQFVQAAEHGDVGIGGLTINDATGTAGHNSDAIVGHKTIQSHETLSSSSNTYTGFVGQRRYHRSTMTGDTIETTAVARDIDVTLYDMNAQAGFSIFHDGQGVRPAETVSARITWLLTGIHTFFRVVDNGLVASSSVTMDANNYDGQTPADVLADCALKAGYNWWIWWDPVVQRAALFFDNSNTSTAFTSLYRISNVDSDISSSSNTFAPFVDAELTRDPVHTYSGVYMPWDGGATYDTNGAVASNFASRDGAAPTASVKSSAAASALVTRLLSDASSEADKITATIRVEPQFVNAIRAGHRMQVKFSHLPGYESFTWCRVLRKTITQPNPMGDDRYDIALELSPQCPDVSITNVADVTITGGSPIEPFPFTAAAGNLYILFQAYRTQTTATTPTGWTLVGKIDNLHSVSHSLGVYALDADGSTNSASGLPTTNTWGIVYEIANGPSAASLASDASTATGSTTGNAPVGTPVPMTCAAVTAGRGMVLGLFAFTNDGGGGITWTSGGGATQDETNLSGGFGPQMMSQHQTTTGGSVAPSSTLVELSPPTGAFTTEPVKWGALAVALDGTNCR